MRYAINPEECLKCGQCLPACPYEAIYQDEKGNYFINPEKCQHCDNCFDVCPARAIHVLEEEEEII